MNRDFDEEYKVYMEKDIPDLWDRIEAGIEAEEKTKKKTKKKTVPLKKRYLGLLIAACVCGLIILPLGFGGMLNRKSEKSATGASAENSVMADYATFDQANEEACAEVEAVAEECDEAVKAETPASEELDTVPNVMTDAPIKEIAATNNGDTGAMLCGENMEIVVVSSENAEEGIRYRIKVISGDTSNLVFEKGEDELNVRLFTEGQTVENNTTYYVNLYNMTPQLSSFPIYDMEVIE